MKYLYKIWPLIILMMIAPGRNAIGMPDATEIENPGYVHSNFSTLATGTVTSAFILHDQTVFSIGKNTSVQLKGNLHLHSSITGQGKLVLKGDQKLIINANGNSIAKLVINNPEGVELMSQLNIANELSVEEGKLYMNDFNIVLNHSFVRVSIHGEAAIAFNGNGRIIGQVLQPLANTAHQVDHSPAPSFCLLLAQNEQPGLLGTQIQLHNDCNFHSTTPQPPTPPPD